MSDPFSTPLTGDGGPVAQLAVTVVVARPVADRDGPFEVLLSERGRGAFARGLWVFPGGRVDPEDAVARADVDPSTVLLADRFGLTLAKASALVCGAVRELAEEAAIVAPGPRARLLDDASWTAVRAGDFTFEAPSGPLYPLARWLPPPIERRRFDTFFLVCEAPPGLGARADGDELRAHRWVTPVGALEAFRAQELPLLPPTFRTLMELAAFPTFHTLRTALAQHWPPVNSPVVRAATAAEGIGVVTEIPAETRPGLDGGRGHPFHFDGERWRPLDGGD